ncbi:MAG: HTH-type transcriptional repressor ComR [Herbaspirillum frisingense]|uniref:HTH-type transcriptional repressor ComR n=1 Tax=Herbaspirillum frisingense TaxID=92645 RepID=A0A7V8FTR6_9BURK|nr:MAG: HTH-type transcriptional repressor ComR [Herbaspirillum frisingense]
MGRHREFDVEQALDSALCVFWRKGYEGASYTDLTQATGVERPALYSAFGNKEALFLLALERYYNRFLSFVPAALAQPSAREVAAHILRGSIELHTLDPNRSGCLGVHGALAGSDESEPIRQAIVDGRARDEALLRERFERAKQDGDLPDTTDCEALAAYLCAVVHGLAVQAKAGFSRAKLESIAEQVLSTWPVSARAKGSSRK